jgi:hypothetical protein
VAGGRSSVARGLWVSRITEVLRKETVGGSPLVAAAVTASIWATLAFRVGREQDAHVKIGVLCGSLLAVLLATVVLRRRNRVYRRLCAREPSDPGRARTGSRRNPREPLLKIDVLGAMIAMPPPSPSHPDDPSRRPIPTTTPRSTRATFVLAERVP